MIFVVPTEAKRDDDTLYGVRKLSYFANGMDYNNIYAYGYVANKMFADVIVRIGSDVSKLGYSSEVYVVSRFTTAINSDGTPVQKLYVYKDGKEMGYEGEEGVDCTIATLDPATVYQPGVRTLAPNESHRKINTGDVIRFSLNAKGRIAEIQLFFSAESSSYYPANPLDGNNGQFTLGYGVIDRIEKSTIKYKRAGSENDFEYYTGADKFKIYVYNAKENSAKKLRVGDLTDIVTTQMNNPSTVVYYTKYGQPNTLVVYNY